MHRFHSAMLGMLLAAGAIGSAHADTLGSPWSLVMKGGLTTGSGSDGLQIGGLVEVGAGVQWKSPNMPIAVQGTVNYHVDRAWLPGGKVTFGRVPVEGIVYYTGINKWRFGAGIRYVAAPNITVKIDDFEGKGKFKDTVGGVLEAGYALTDHTSVNIRYVSERFRLKRVDVKGIGGSDIDDDFAVNGNHFGVNLVYAF